MKRTLLASSLVISACGAGEANPPSTPPPSPPLPSVIAPLPPEIKVIIEKDLVVARDKEGRELFHATVKGARRAIAAPGGGAFVLDARFARRLNSRGEERWKAEIKVGKELFAARDHLVVSTGGRMQLFEGEDGIDHGVIVADDAGVERQASAPLTSFRVPLRLFPGHKGDAHRSIAVDPSGLLLVGAADGSLVGLDFDGEPRFQLGVRGSVSEVHLRPSGGFDVITSWGTFVVDPVARTVIEPPSPLMASLDFRAEPWPRAPDVVFGPADAWALESRFENDERERRLHHFDGKTWSHVPAPEITLMSSPLLSGATEFNATSLARGPQGQLLVIGLEQTWSKVAPAMSGVALHVLERSGKDLRERRDLKKPSNATGQPIESSVSGPTYALGPGGREVFCVADTCIAKGLSPSFRVEGGAPPKALEGGWIAFEWPDGAGWWENKPIVFAGEALWRLDKGGVYRDGKKVHEPPSDEQLYDEFGYGESRSPPARALWASGPNDVWIAQGIVNYGSVLLHWDGAAFTRVKAPLQFIEHIGGAGPNDLWFAGDGVARYDGRAMRRVAGIPAGAIVPGASGDVWIGNWRVTARAGKTEDIEGKEASVPPVAAPSAPLALSAIEPGIRLDPILLTIPGERPLTAALGAEEGPTKGFVWFHDRQRIVEYDGASARLIHRATPQTPLDGQRCAAIKAPGEGAFLSTGPDRMVALRTVAQGTTTDVVWLPALLAIGASPSGDVWAVSASSDDMSPRAVVAGRAGLRAVKGLPLAAYAGVSVRADNDVWLAGGLLATDDGTRAWPAGEGALVHFDGGAFTRHRAPDGALLAVSAVGPNEAWAVGLDGGLVHVKDTTVRAYHVEVGGARLRVALRAVAARGPNDVWIAGDHAMLLRWDGSSLKRAGTGALPADTVFTAVIPPGDKQGYVVGPAGMWAIRR